MFTFMIIIVGIAAVSIAITMGWRERLAEKEDELSRWSVALDERANKLAQWEKELIRWQLGEIKGSSEDTDRP